MMRRNVSLALMVFAGLTVAVAATSVYAQAPSAQDKTAQGKAAPAAKHDLSGVWIFDTARRGGSILDVAPENDMPPMTPWGQAKYDKNSPGHGKKAVIGDADNDPILQCDPAGFPRVVAFPTAFEFVQTPKRIFQFFEQEHAWRPIWMDGRPVPKDADPTWFGVSVGHWEGDHTLVVESVGFTDRTWLGAAGYPHSEDMRVTERYERVDGNTIHYDVRVDDPKAYTKPIIAPTKTFITRPGYEIGEVPCVWSDENAFSKRIREPAAAEGKPKN
jgi:hypothetical protein